MKREKCYLVRHAYCSTECHCPCVQSKTGLLLSGLIAPLDRISALCIALYFWMQPERCIFFSVDTCVNLYFCGNICFAKQVMAQIYHTVAHLFLVYIQSCCAASADLELMMQDGWGEEDCNNSHLGSYCSTHVMCNLPDPRCLE